MNRTKEVNKLLRGMCKSDKAFNNALYAYLRAEDFNPLWDKYNRVKFLRELYKINRKSKQKISLGLTDCKFHGRKLKQPKSIVTSTNIYYKPIYETILTIGIPGIVSADFEE